MLKIIGLTPQEDQLKYDLPLIKQMLEMECVDKVKKIISNPEHQITRKLDKKTSIETEFEFRLRARTAI